MANTNKEMIAKIVKEEIDKEDFREAVDREKARIIEKRGQSIWRKLFPFKIKIVRI